MKKKKKKRTYSIEATEPLAWTYNCVLHSAVKLLFECYPKNPDFASSV